MTGWQYRDFPNVEAVVINYLRSRGLPRVSASLPAAPVWPCLTVYRIGGRTSPGRALDLASLQLSSWGDSKESARALLASALTYLWEMPGSYPGPEQVTSVDSVLGMSWQPDDSVTPERPRYVAGVQISIR